jgi:hypothetical protein
METVIICGVAMFSVRLGVLLVVSCYTGASLVSLIKNDLGVG